MEKVLVIVGPTAVGKTALSIELAQRYHGEIISGDSMQVYRQLDIGTAKVQKEETAGIAHYLIDNRAIEENYSVAEFQKEARQKIAEITQRGKLPIVVGGTGLYIQALLYDFQLGVQAEPAVDDAFRQRYQAYAETHGNEKLWQVLQKKDPLAAEKIHFNNQRKVIRALEVVEKTGTSIMQPQETPAKLYDYFLVGLTTERSVLYERINQRVEQMMASGLEKEAQLLRSYPESQAAKGIGYKEFLPYFANEQTLAETVARIQQNSRRYAKRQLTWFRNRMQPFWVDLAQSEEKEAVKHAIDKWLEAK
ncbi:MAG: tRNA (adenosine(37)-N6)-dimethylallyltransferase MiaA [Enterococcus sp.]